MKKWTYLVASLLLAGTTPLLTGCVDTDEPSGIEELRGAKAELLKAKAAVEAAKVAQVQAEAAYKNAEAEYKKAEAALVLAQAAYWEAKTENEKLAAQQALEAAIEAARYAAAQWEYELAILKESYKQCLMATLEYRNEALEPYTEELKEAKKALDDAADELVEAQRSYEDALAQIEEDEEYKDLLTRKLQKKVIRKQRKVAGAEAALEEAKAAYAEAQNMELNDLAVRYEELADQLAALEDEMNKVKAAEAEAKYQIRMTEGLAIAEDAEAFANLKDEKQALPAFSLELKGGLPYGLQGTIVSEEAEYSWNDRTNYTNRKKDLNKLLKTVNTWVRDENDNEWTKESIAKLKYELEVEQEDFDVTLAIWKELVAAYHTNEYPTTDPTQITGYDELKDAVEAYNEAAEAYNALEADLAAAKAAKAAADEAAEKKLGGLDDDTNYGKISGTIYDAWKAAYDAAENKETGTKNGAAKAAADEWKRLSDAVTNAEKVRDEAKAKDEAESTAETRRALAIAEADLEEAELQKSQAVDEGTLKDKIVSDAETLRAKEETAADAEREKAIEAAIKEWDAAVKPQQAIIDEIGKFSTADSKLKLAYKEAKAAAKEADAALQVFAKNAKLNNEFLLKDFVNTLVVRTQDDNGVYGVATTTIEEVAALSKDGLQNSIVKLSKKLFGTAGKNAYGDFNARLIEYTADEIAAMVKADIEALMTEGVGENGNLSNNAICYEEYESIFANYGSLGTQLALKNQIEFMTAYLDNSADVDAIIAAVEEELDATVAAFEALKESVTAAKEALQARRDAYKESLADTEEPRLQLEAEQKPLRQLYRDYKEIISDIKSGLNAAEDKAAYSSKALEKYINKCAKAVTKAEDALFDAQTKLMQAEKDLADWNTGAISGAETTKRDLEDAQTKYNRAEEAYQAALDALNAAIAYLASFE